MDIDELPEPKAFCVICNRSLYKDHDIRMSLNGPICNYCEPESEII
jgi:hypothetical protein